MNKNTGTNVDERAVAEVTSQAEYEKPFEEWSSAGIGNAFLFGKVMTANPDLLLELLQYSLPEYHIQKIEDVQREVDIKLSIDSHGVRLDILTTDEHGRHIDVEMQMRDEKNIPHRMRFYEGTIDQMAVRVIFHRNSKVSCSWWQGALILRVMQRARLPGAYRSRYELPDAMRDGGRNIWNGK